MKSIKFPKMFTRNSTNIVSDYDATLQNLKMLLLSEKGELFGDPYFGTGLRKYMFDQNDAVLQDILVDDLYSTISLFMPQLKINRNDVKIMKRTTNSGKSELTLSLKATNKASFTTDLYNIVLLEAEV